MPQVRHNTLLGAAALATILGGVGTQIAQPLSAAAATSHVYVLNNPNGTNSISMYMRDEDGKLTLEGTKLIGGMGTGAHLGTQGALIRANHYLFAVDAGSNQISVVDDSYGALTLKGVYSSGGADPVSLSYKDGHLYVVNAGNTTTAGNVMGFNFDDGKLMPIAGSDRPLSAAQPGPAEVAVSPDGNALVVTEKGTNSIDTYHINGNGSLEAGLFTPATGATPFGFAFNPAHSEEFLVSDAFGGAAGAGAVTSYKSVNGKNLSVIQGPVANTQSAPCWVAFTPNGDYAFVTNTASSNVSVIQVNDNGTVVVKNTASTGVGSAPAEVSVSQYGHFVFVLDGVTNTISVFTFHNGMLTAVPQTGITLPASAVGLANNS